jgi:succinate dehydrogenase / fumarate reductase, cytochrome b subunit
MSMKMSNIFLLRRLHSLSGVVPISAFLLEHFYTNFAAVESPKAYDNAVAFLRVLLPGPLLPISEIALIGLPILFHGLLGIYIAYTMRNNAPSYSYLRNWLYFFQRIAGIYLFVFIALHVASMRFGFWGLSGNHLSVSDHATDPIVTPFSIVHADLSEHVVLGFYLLGILAAAYHFGYGLWSFGIHWGITVSERAQKTSQIVCAGLGVLVLLFGIVSAIAFV